jgi:hypothetical protein
MVMWMGKHYHEFNKLINCPFELLFRGRGGEGGSWIAFKFEMEIMQKIFPTKKKLGKKNCQLELTWLHICSL